MVQIEDSQGLGRVETNVPRGQRPQGHRANAVQPTVNAWTLYYDFRHCHAAKGRSDAEKEGPYLCVRFSRNGARW